MTLAGSGEIAYTHETSFTTVAGTPTWYRPGEDITLDDFTLTRNLSRSRSPDDPRPKGSRAGNREVSMSLSFSLTDTNWHDMVFANGGASLAQTGSLAPTATWYVKSKTLPGTEERFVQGGAVESVSINYSQGEDVTIDLSIIGAQEIGAGDGSSPSVPSSIVTQSKDDIVTFAGADFNLNGSQLSAELQSFSFDISNMAQFNRGQQQTPTSVEVGPYEPSFNVEAILNGSTQRELAYGTSGATQPQDTVDSSSGEITLANPSGNLVSYNLSDLQPTNYQWASVISADTNTTDPTEYHATDIAVA